MRILIADLFSLSHIESLKSQGCEVLYDDKLNGESLEKAIASFDPHLLVVRSTKVQVNHFTAGKSLEAVIRAGSGYDTIDKNGANEKGIFVANCPGKNSVAVAELAFGLLLAIDRRIVSNDTELKAKKWNKGEYINCKGIKGRTLGIIGFGNVGQEMAKRALAFDMNVIVSSRTKPTPSDARIKVAENLDELLGSSDIVTLHLPSTSVSKSMVTADFLNKMKKDGVLINTSRGALIDEKALVQHLNENPQFWCGLDVFLDEPTDKKGAFTNDLAQHPRTVGTHHIGASTKQSEEAIGQEAYRMILEYKKTGIMPNCVNMSVVSTNIKVLGIKYHNTPEFFEGMFAVVAKNKVKVLEAKTEVFEKGTTGISKIKFEECSAVLAELEAGFNALKDLISFKWE